MKEIFDASEYVQVISSITLKDLMTIEFRRGANIQWESLTKCLDAQKKMYLCNVCNVCQYGDKNLFSHLSGKKHHGKMETVSQFFLPNAPGRKPNTNAQKAAVGKKVMPANKQTNLAQANKPQEKVAPLKVVAKTTAAAGSPKPNIKPTTTTNVAANNSLAATTKVPNKTICKPVAKVAPKAVTTPNTKINVSKAAATTTPNTTAALNKAKPATVGTLKTATTLNPGNNAANQLNKVKPVQPSIPKTAAISNSGNSAANQFNKGKPAPPSTPKTAAIPNPGNNAENQLNKGKPAPPSTPKTAAIPNPVNNAANQLNKGKPAPPSTPKAVTATNIASNAPKAALVSKAQPSSETNKTKPVPLGTAKLGTASIKPSNLPKESSISNSNTNAEVNKVMPTAPKAVSASCMSSNANKEDSVVNPATAMEISKAKPAVSKTNVVLTPSKVTDLVKETKEDSPKPVTPATGVKPVIFNIKKVVSTSKQSLTSNVLNKGKTATSSDLNKNTVKEPLLAKPANEVSKSTTTKLDSNSKRSDSSRFSSIGDGVNEQNDDCVVILSSEEQAKNVREPTQQNSIASTATNLVLNPFSAVAQQKKISCVPLSKLMTMQPIESKTQTKERVKVVEGKAIQTISNKTESSRHREDKKIKNRTERSTDKNYTRSETGPGTSESLFRSSSLALLGVEYVIKIVKNINDKSPKFNCSLCDISTDETTMISHLVGYNHRLKYCDKHFATALRQFNQYIAHVPEHMRFNVLSPILEKLATAIEKHHGRESVYMCYEHLYMRNRTDVTLTVFNRRHASEMSGPSFTHAVDTAEVTALIENVTSGNYQPPAIAANSNFSFPTYNDPNEMYGNSNNYANYPRNNDGSNSMVDDETHKRMVDNFLRDTQKTQPLRNRNLLRGEKRTKSRSKSPQRKRRRSSSLIKSQWNLERRSISPLRDEDIWQAYRHMVDQSVRDLNTTFELYKKDAEQHPLYNSEWQKFWKRRKDELIAAGINHRTYNYQNEWILFFNARLEELYNQDVENIKIKCRERLCLPMTNNELPNTKYHVHIFEEEPNIAVSPEKPTIEEPKPVVEIVNDVNVIHVLRLLTALEDFLGSLGPKITQLLAIALQMFKLQPEKANSQFLTSENCAILETAKEKFTGLVISKILDPAQERAVKRAINDTEALLKYAADNVPQSVDNDIELDEVRQRTLVQKPINKPETPKKSERSDRAELVAKLASTLISQGKTTIDQDQLLQIVQVYSLIKQKNNPNQDAPSTSRLTSSSEPTRSSPGLELRPNRNQSDSINELTSYRTTNNNQNTNRSPFTNNFSNSITNPSMMRDMSNMNFSANSSVDMPRPNNLNTLNHNGMDNSYNGQDGSQYNQYNRGMFTGGNSTTQTSFNDYNNRNFQPNFMDGNFNYGSNNNNAGGQHMDWM